mmetsp:Transcript_26591/g.33221  ORF Transcript_26591/g.33221 Transcript_26591/m.33221 type:complete len:235 (+) Transcript_26591:74-778(+)
MAVVRMSGKKRKITEEVCGVCDENQSKYRCPKCLVNYCSLHCFKQHKEKNEQSKLPSFCEVKQRSASEICDVCQNKKPKYTCPQCLIKYCSISCYKQHKKIPLDEDASESLCEKIASKKNIGNFSGSLFKKTKKEKEMTKDEEEEELEILLSTEQKEKIKNNYTLRMALKDEKLKSILCHIHDADNRAKELEKAKLSECFTKVFLDTLLPCIGVHQVDSNGEMFLSLPLKGSKN